MAKNVVGRKGFKKCSKEKPAGGVWKKRLGDEDVLCTSKSHYSNHKQGNARKDSERMSGNETTPAKPKVKRMGGP